MYQIRINLNISEIRSLLKRFNKLKLTPADRMRCKNFDMRVEQKLADKEVDHYDNKAPYYLT